MTRPYIDHEQLGGLPLPRRLGDPVLIFRRVCGWWLVVAPLIILQSVVMPALQSRALVLVLLWPYFLYLWRALPGQRTNAFYLRAFRTDASTADIRKAIQAALGNHYRLSGIRAPRRRWPKWLRALARAAFCLHYSSVRYMNLEAGDDWLARLWRSLGEARCAFIDLVDVTEHVAAEIALTCRALGFERVMFLGDDSRSIAEWQNLACKQLGDLHVKPGDIQVAIWHAAAPEERAAFQRAVNDFQHRLPLGTAGLNWNAFPAVRSAALTYGQRWQEAAFEVGTFLLCLIPVLILNAAPTVLAAEFPQFGSVAGLVVSLALFLFLGASVVQFIRECPVPSQQEGFALGFAGLLLFYTGIAAWLAGKPLVDAAHEWLASLHPPVIVRVESSSPLANARVIADTIAAPIEQQVNGVERATELRSWSLADGTCTLDVRFEPATDSALAQTLVANRVALADPVIPQAASRPTTRAVDPAEAIIAFVIVSSPDGKFDSGDLSEYATVELKDALARLPGVAGVSVFGASRWASRLVIDTHRLGAHGLSGSEVRAALERLTAGAVPKPEQVGPARFRRHAPIQVARLGDVTELELETHGGRPVLMRDVARLEPGIVGAISAAHFRQKPVVALAVTGRSPGRAHEVTGTIRKWLAGLEPRLPEGLRVALGIDFTPNFEAPRASTTPSYVLIDVTLPDHASIDRTTEVLLRCESVLGGVAGVRDVLALTEHPFDIPRNRPCLLMRLDSAGRADTIAELGKSLGANFPGVRFQFRDLSAKPPFPAIDFPISLAVCDVQDAGAAALLEAAESLAAALSNSPLVADVVVRRPQLIDEALVEVDSRRLLERGVSRAAAVDTIDLLMNPPLIVSPQGRDGRPIDADPWRPNDRAARDTEEMLRRAVVLSASGDPISLADLVQIRIDSTEDVVERLNFFFMIELRANLAPGASLSEARAFCEQEGERRLSASFRLQWLQKRGRP